MPKGKPLRNGNTLIAARHRPANRLHLAVTKHDKTDIGKPSEPFSAAKRPAAGRETARSESQDGPFLNANQHTMQTAMRQRVMTKARHDKEFLHFLHA